MNKFSSKIKKTFCLILSISLLFSNINVFAQDMHIPATRPIIKEQLWNLLIKKLEPALVETQYSYEQLYKAVQAGDAARYQPLIADYQRNLANASHIYSEYKGIYNAYNAFLTQEEATAEVERLARQYLAAPGEELPQHFVLEEDVLFSKLRSIIGKFDNMTPAQISEEMLGFKSEIPFLQENLLHHFERLDMMDYHRINMRAYKLDMKSSKYIHVKPHEVLEYAYKHLNSQARAGADLHLQLSTNPEEIIPFIRSMKRYYRNFKQVKVPSFIKMFRNLRSMNYAARENYLLTEVTTDLTEGNLKLIKDIEKFQTGTRAPFVKNLMKSGPLVIIGSIAIALTVTYIAAGNNYTASSMTPGKFAELKTAIENNDPNLTVEDLFNFYESDRAEELIINDIDHALAFSNMILSAKETENDMQLLADRYNEEQNVRDQIINSIPDDPTQDTRLPNINDYINGKGTSRS